MKHYKVELDQVRYLFKQDLPFHIVRKLHMWVKQVEKIGLMETRKISSYHDEPLKGHRLGQRSIRLSISYRAFYQVEEASDVITIIVIEVNKHEY